MSGILGKGKRPSVRPDVARTVVAAMALLAFWGALAYAFWPEFLPAAMGIVQGIRGAGARAVDSQCLQVRDNSSASDALLAQVVEQLDRDCLSIHQFLGREVEYRLPVLITDGSGPALTDGTRLLVFHDRGRVGLRTAPFFLALLVDGSISLVDLSLFVEGGYAVYVAEEIGRAAPVLGQESDAWVVRLREQGTYLPLQEAWAVGLPDSERAMEQGVRALLEGGSFVGWVVETHGLEAVEALRSGVSIDQVLGITAANAEDAWLSAVTAERAAAQPCIEVVPRVSPLYGYCAAIEGAIR